MTGRVRVAATWLAVAAVCGAFLAAAAPRPAPPRPPPPAAAGGVVNSQITYDTFGARLDAHDGTIVQDPAGTMWLFGTSYGCGFQLSVSLAWCGVRVYRSTDLQTWAPAGAVGGMYAFDHLGGGWQARCGGQVFGCFRPHVARRPDGTWVMWLNVAHSAAGYAVLTAPAPGGPYAEVPDPPALAVSDGSGMPYGDQDITPDPADPAVAWIAYTAIDHAGGGNVHDIVVERLDPAWTSGTGQFARLGKALVEAPGLFVRGGRWYLVYSDPACPYCATTAGWASAPGPLGPWTVSPLRFTACGGQPADVNVLRRPAGGVVPVYQTDRWVRGAGNALVANQYLANNYLAPLTFSPDGSIPAQSCVGQWTLV